MNKEDRVLSVVLNAKAALDGVQTILSNVWVGSDDPSQWWERNVPALKQAQAMLAVIEMALGDANVAAIKVADELDRKAGDE